MTGMGQSDIITANKTSNNDWTELGGLVRPANNTPVGEGIYFLLLLSLGYCFKSYRSISKKN